MTRLKITRSKSYSVDRVTPPIKSLMKPSVEKITPVSIVVDNTLASKLYHFKFDLYNNIRSQKNIQDSIEYLDHKQESLLKIKYLCDTLAYLSNIYFKSSPHSDNRSKIVHESNNILTQIEYLAGKIDSKSIPLISSTGRHGTLFSKDLQIYLTPHPCLTDSKFINIYEIHDLLSKPAIIQENIIYPVNSLIDECESYKSLLYNYFLEENSIAEYNVESPSKCKNISKIMWDNLAKIQDSILNSLINLRFQTDNLSRSNVQELLK